MRYTDKLKLNLSELNDPMIITPISENFEKIESHLQTDSVGYKIGDVRSSFRKIQSDEWLLCNGSTYDPKKYPELAKINPSIDQMISLMTNYKYPEQSYSFNSGSNVIYCVANDNIHSVCTDGANYLGVIKGKQSTYVVYFLIWSSDNFKTYTIVQNFTVDSSANIFYINGYWYVVYNNNTTIAIADKAFGSFTSINLSTINSTTRLTYCVDMQYTNGKYHLVALYNSPNNSGITYDNAIVLSDTDPKFSNPTRTYIIDNCNTSMNHASFVFTGEKYVLIRFYNSKIYDVSWSSSIDGTYQTRTVDTISDTPYFNTNMTYKLRTIHKDGKLYWIGVNTASSPHHYELFYLESIESGNFGSVTLSNIPISNSNRPSQMFIINGALVFLYPFLDNEIYYYTLAISKDDYLNPFSWRSVINPTQFESLDFDYTYFNYQDNNYLCQLALINRKRSIIKIPIYGLPKSDNAAYNYIKVK